jgi:hypothetical protein
MRGAEHHKYAPGDQEGATAEAEVMGKSQSPRRGFRTEHDDHDQGGGVVSDQMVPHDKQNASSAMERTKQRGPPDGDSSA